MVEEKLPSWAAAYKKVIFVSLLQLSFDTDQNQALEDYIELSLMSQCNSRDYSFFESSIFSFMLAQMSYYASLCLYAFSTCYAQNYASIIRKTLVIYTVHSV